MNEIDKFPAAKESPIPKEAKDKLDELEEKIRKSQPIKQSFISPTQEQLGNRFTYHAPKADQTSRYEIIRMKILECASSCVALSPCSPEQARALNALDEAMFLFNAAIARNE